MQSDLTRPDPEQSQLMKLIKSSSGCEPQNTRLSSLLTFSQSVPDTTSIKPYEKESRMLLVEEEKYSRWNCGRADYFVPLKIRKRTRQTCLCLKQLIEMDSTYDQSCCAYASLLQDWNEKAIMSSTRN